MPVRPPNDSEPKMAPSRSKPKSGSTQAALPLETSSECSRFILDATDPARVHPLTVPEEAVDAQHASLGLRFGARRPDLVRPADGQASPR